MVNNRSNFIRRIDEKGALDSMLLYRESKISEDAMCLVCWPYLGRVSREMQHRIRFASIDTDDLQSELWLLFKDKIIRSYDTSYGPLTPYVMKYAQYVCRNMLKKDKSVVYFDNDELLEIFGNNVEHSSCFDECFPDKKQALEKIAKSLAQRGIVRYDAIMNNTAKIPVPGFEVSKDVPTVSVVSVPERRRGSELSENSTPIHKELRNIRMTLGYSQAMMADCLGIGGPRYASYEYGRTSSVPEAIMAAARAELELDKGDVSQLKHRFSATMDKIVEQWLNMVGDDCDHVKLATICGVSLSTVKRWATNKTRPSLAFLNYRESMVISWISATKKSVTKTNLQPKKSFGQDGLSD